jgi:hypothetical protein
MSERDGYLRWVYLRHDEIHGLGDGETISHFWVRRLQEVANASYFHFAAVAAHGIDSTVPVVAGTLTYSFTNAWFGAAVLQTQCGKHD